MDTSRSEDVSAAGAAAPSTEQLWRALAADLRGYLLRRVRDAALAEDLLQETFVKIHERLPELRDSERVAAWVHRIARSTLIDHLRRRADAPDGEAAADRAARTAPDEPDPSDARNEEVASWLPAMLATLPEPYREALRLTEIEGVSQAALARRLGLSPSGARTRVQRARELLRRRLDDCCLVELDRRGNVLSWRRRSSCACDGGGD